MLSGNICYFNTLSNTFVDNDKSNDKTTDKKTIVLSEVGIKEPIRGTTRDSHRVRYSKEPSINFSETDMRQLKEVIGHRRVQAKSRDNSKINISYNHAQHIKGGAA